MPELAEVEYFRQRWNPGLGSKVLSVELHDGKRIFRGTDSKALVKGLTGATLIGSEARGKQMAFRFSRGNWLAIHLGMTGTLRAERADFAAATHDHLLLRQRGCALVFRDPRQFGRVLHFHGMGEPPWWSSIAPALTSDAFTRELLHDALQRHRRLPIKGTLLLQKHFPGVGNWMADEILWRTRIDPRCASGKITDARLGALWKAIRFVCQGAMKHISGSHADPPRDWFFHERWEAGGHCPRDGAMLKRATVGGRTTAWCPKCQ